QAVLEHQVDMGSRFPPRHPLVLRRRKVDHHHPLSGGAPAPNNQTGGDSMYVPPGLGEAGGGNWFLAPAPGGGANNVDASGIALVTVWYTLKRRGLWWLTGTRWRQVDGLVHLERVQTLRAEFAAHAALLDAAERGDGVIDVVVDPDRPGANAAGDVGRAF